MAKKILQIIFIVCLFFIISIQVFAQNIRPQITFGDILNNTYQTKQIPQNSIEKQKQIQEFLTLIEENGKKSKNSFYLNNIPTPTPNASSLADNVAGYFITPIPTLDPLLESLIARVPSNIGQGDLKPLKESYTIALLGDSMTETLGENLPDLSNLLTLEYPRHNFVLLNYGQGSTTIEDGLYRLDHPTKYDKKDYPPLLPLQPDIIVVESFAYNHWDSQMNGLNREWQTAANIIDMIKQYNPDTKIILLATLSPNPEIFGDGILNWSKDKKWDAAITTKAYLQNFINFAASSHLPLADAYHPSLNSDGHGDPKYISSSDHIHPSDEGKQLISQKIFDTIKQYGMIN